MSSDQVAEDLPTRILHVATELFTSNGFGTTTVRDIVEITQSNVAAVNYHFGSKDALIREVAINLLSPVQKERQRMLSVALREHDAGHQITAEKIIRAFVYPLVYAARSRDGGRLVVRLLMQMWVEPGLSLHTFVMREYNRNARKFINAFQICLPHLDVPNIVWRYEAMRGTVIHLLNDCDPRTSKLQLLSKDTLNPNKISDEDLLDYLILTVDTIITGKGMILKKDPDKS
mgnify:CR=1 FL=1